MAAAKAAAIKHYVVVSIVGCDELPDSGYMRAKVAQEKLVEQSDLPYSIVRATQFAEFADAITASMTVGDEVRVPDALIQPIPAADLATEVAHESSPKRRANACRSTFPIPRIGKTSTICNSRGAAVTSSACAT